MEELLIHLVQTKCYLLVGRLSALSHIFSIFGADNNVLTSRCFLFPILFGKRKRPRLPERMLGSNHILSEAARTLEHWKSGIIPFFIRRPDFLLFQGRKRADNQGNK